MRNYVIIFFIAVIHTLPLWDTKEIIASGTKDGYAHAAIGEWYCKNVVTHDYDFSGFMAPFGINTAGNYDSPFPFILTCPAESFGPIAQFHFFIFFQVLLILISSMLLARHIFTDSILRWAYVFFVWFCGFYIDRVNVPTTIFSMIWGMQLSMYALFTLQLNNLKSSIISFSLISLSLAGTFFNIPALFFILIAFAARLFIQLKPNHLPRMPLIKNALFGLSAALIIFLYFWSPMVGFTLTNINPVFNPSSYRADASIDLLKILEPFQNLSLVNVPNLLFAKIAGIDVIIFLLFIFLLFRKKTWQNRLYLISIILVFICLRG